MNPHAREDLMAHLNITQSFFPPFLNDLNLTDTLRKDFALCDTGNIVFHWADFFETCDLMKEKLESGRGLLADFKHRDFALKNLKLLPVWLKTDKKVYHTTVFDLYESYIFNPRSVLSGLDLMFPLEISFISSTGPFRGMSVADCLNISTFRDFVIISLLQERLPRRNYRIRLKSKILLEYGPNFEQAELVALEQLSINGILLSVDSEVYLRKIQNIDSVRFLVNFRSLAGAKGKSLNDFKGYLSQYAFNLLYSSMRGDSVTCRVRDFSVQASFDLARNRRVFLYVTYDKLEASNPECIGVIREFVEQTRELVRGHYQPPKFGKSA
jgi:hypothetical protein